MLKGRLVMDPNIEAIYEGLREFAEGQANCPCCVGVYECDPECTIEADGIRSGHSEVYERMCAARRALKGE